ncbi:hypothetical protein ACH47B_31690 [Rhodococcus sp. NPDC019627]|uniref:hypothetical protein n=1 Tax=unclassified Rhodococcus (in: high G+C Gram-positive bacteria) TaxID=192944 RepID=UPI003403B332
MRQRMGQLATIAAASVETLILTNCSTTTDVPETFAATVTVTGEANLASAESGECTIGENRVSPNDKVVILGDTGSAFAEAPMEVGSIDQNPDGTGLCTYTAHFDDIPANQRSYNITVTNPTNVTNFAPQSFSPHELKNGATYRLYSSPPTNGGTGTDRQDTGGTPEPRPL